MDYINIVVYHALATLTGGAGCLPASQPRARQPGLRMKKKIKKSAGLRPAGRPAGWLAGWLATGPI